MLDERGVENYTSAWYEIGYTGIHPSINTRLRTIQDHVIREAERMIPQLKTRVADMTDPLVDFEVEVRVTYHLREDDPAYDENDDNIFVEQEDSVTHMLDYDDHCYRS